MLTQLINGVEPLPNDHDVMARLVQGEPDPYTSGADYGIAIRNRAGQVYRTVTCESFHEFVRTHQRLMGLGFRDEVPEMAGDVDGFSAILSPR